MLWIRKKIIEIPSIDSNLRQENENRNEGQEDEMAGVELLTVGRAQVDGVEHHLHRVRGHQGGRLRVHGVVGGQVGRRLLLE